MEGLIADKRYDADYVIKAAKEEKAEAVIPSNARRKAPRESITRNCIKNEI